MSTPILTIPLTGNPRRGMLQLPAPRPTYEVEAIRTATGAELTLRRDDRVTRITMTRFDPGLDADLVAIPAYHHAIALLDGYRWMFRADAGFYTLTLTDQVQPYVGPYAAVDPAGRVL